MGSQLLSLITNSFESGLMWATLAVAVLLILIAFIARTRKGGLRRFRFRCDISWEGEGDKISEHNDKRV